jgi:hypothetical protein
MEVRGQLPALAVLSLTKGPPIRWAPELERSRKEKFPAAVESWTPVVHPVVGHCTDLSWLLPNERNPNANTCITCIT